MKRFEVAVFSSESGRQVHANVITSCHFNVFSSYHFKLSFPCIFKLYFPCIFKLSFPCIYKLTFPCIFKFKQCSNSRTSKFIYLQGRTRLTEMTSECTTIAPQKTD